MKPPRLLTLEDRSVPAIGGGLLHAGVLGEYFANESLAGQPAFVRRDVRIDFDWGTLRSPGGSRSGDFSTVTADHFSARWTGQVSPRFTESYSFQLTSDERARLDIRPAGATTWTSLIDHWTPHTSTTDLANITLTANATYDLRIEYAEGTAAANVALHWSSPSTPLEVVEAVSTAALNVHSGNPQANLGNTLYADAVKMGRDEWGNPNNYFAGLVDRDANGWPLADATLIVWEGRDSASVAGTYRLRFTGRADVTSLNGIAGTFRVGTTDYGFTLPAGVGYDPVTNMTTAEFTSYPIEIQYLTFRNSQRTAGDSRLLLANPNAD